jgi:hypothetical protein
VQCLPAPTVARAGPVGRVPGSRPDAAKRLELEDARLKQRNDVRTTLLQGLAGAVVAVGLSLTWRQIRVNQEGQITERFNKAVDHLGTDKLDLRLGGTYALERIAKNSSEDRDTIAKVLTAFVRQRSPWPPSSPASTETTSRSTSSRSYGPALLTSRPC